MSRQQYTLMKFDPASGEERPYPSHAEQWRSYHGEMKAWLFNPWSGLARSAGDVGSDVQGHLIMPPGEPLFADKDPAAAVEESPEFRELKRAWDAASCDRDRLRAELETLPGVIAAWIKLRVARGYRDDVEAMADAIKHRCWEVDGPGDFKTHRDDRLARLGAALEDATKRDLAGANVVLGSAANPAASYTNNGTTTGKQCENLAGPSVTNSGTATSTQRSGA